MSDTQMRRGNTRPSSGTATNRVWEIADELSRDHGSPAKRADVIRRYQAEGGNYNTASTQYWHWKNQKGSEASEATREPVQYFSVQVKEAGRVLLSAEIRSALGITEGDTLHGVLIDGEVRLMSRKAAARRAQQLVRQHVPEATNLVEELIAERRAEAKNESL